MNAKERFFAVLDHKKTDRVPVMPFSGNWGAKLAGYRLGEYETDGKKMAEAQWRAHELSGIDHVNPQSDNYYIAEGFGLQTRIREDATPVVTKVPLDSLKNIAGLRIPDPYKDGRMPVYLEAIQILSEKAGGNAVVRAPGTGPFSLSGHLLGVEKFIYTIAEAEAEEDEDTQKRILELMEISTESLIAFSTACVKCGADIVQNGDSLCSLNMTSPAIYKKYAYPFQVKYFKAMKELQKTHRFATLLHVCGNNTPIVHEMMSNGCDCIEVDYACDLKKYKEVSQETGTLMFGNLNPAEALLRGTPEEVYLEAMETLRTAGTDNFFVLGSGCELGIASPVDNIRAMVSAAEDFAREGTGGRSPCPMAETC